MKEVEIKIEIADADKAMETLGTNGCVFGEPIVQQDIVYIPNEVPTVPCPAGTNVLRIRKQGEKNILTLKRSDAGNHLSKLELETEISDPVEMDKIIKLLGFKIIADTTKTRRKCRTEKYEICVDEIKDLGSFLEIEEMTEGDAVDAQNEMLQFLVGLGFDIANRKSVGYDVLWVQKYGNAK